MSEFERVTLRDGRTVLLEPKRANTVRARIAELALRDARISRELRFEGPGGYRNSLSKHGGSNHVAPGRDIPQPRTPKEFMALKTLERKATIDKRWRELCR